MKIPKGTLVREVLVGKLKVLEEDMEGGMLLQTDRRFWIKDDKTGTVYIIDLELPTSFS